MRDEIWEKKIKVINFWKFKKTLNSIEQAKSQSKNTVVIEKKIQNFVPQFSRQNANNLRSNNNNYSKLNNFVRPSAPASDFEKENWQNKELQKD